MTKIIDSYLVKYQDINKGTIFQFKEHFYIKTSDISDTYKSEAVDLQTGFTFSFNLGEKVRTYQNIEIHLS